MRATHTPLPRPQSRTGHTPGPGWATPDRPPGSLSPSFSTQLPRSIQGLDIIRAMEDEQAAAASRLQALYRGHHTRTRVWLQPKTAYASLSARLDAECGFGSPSSSCLGPSPQDQVLVSLNEQQHHQAAAAVAAGHGTIYPPASSEVWTAGEIAENGCVPAGALQAKGSTTPPPTTSARSIPPIRPAPANRRREDILMELEWVNASLRERLRVRRRRGCGWAEGIA